MPTAGEAEPQKLKEEPLAPRGNQWYGHADRRYKVVGPENGYEYTSPSTYFKQTRRAGFF